MEDLSDGQLLRRYREGAPAAFTLIVMRHQEALLRHARGVLGRGSSYEDVVQEVFLTLSREKLVLPAEAGGDPDEEHRQLSAWLHKVTRNACMDTIRSETRRRRREREVAARDEAQGGLDAVEAHDTRRTVERELEGLPVDQREVLVLRLLAERSYREIAAITGKKIGTVGWLISEGLKALSARLAPLLETEIGTNRTAAAAPAAIEDARAARGGIR